MDRRLRLAALSLRLTDVAEFLDAFRAKVTASVRDYLLDEVLKRQPDTLQDFLQVLDSRSSLRATVPGRSW
jgi:ATP/maltotriose-dependent transcriptional regulator MalT